MPQSTNTYQVIFDLDNYLKDNNYYDGEQDTSCNQKIVELWDTKFRSALAADIKSKFDNLEIDFEFSEFELNAEDNQGAGAFFHKVVISDKKNLAFIKIFIKTLVNYNKTTVYLDSSYANIDKWKGKSEQLNIMFNQLKTADKNLGYFNPISFTDFVK
jgi:hypothetical protein